jgi:Berberine and berberine like
MALDRLVSQEGRRYMNMLGVRKLTLPILKKSMDAIIKLHKEHGPATNRTMILMTDYPLQKAGVVASDATALYRKTWFNFQVMADWSTRSDLDSYVEEWADSLCREIVKVEESDENIHPNEKIAGKYGYWNGSNGKAPAELTFGQNYPRLRAIKRKYDPKNIFNKWYPIEPAE